MTLIQISLDTDLLPDSSTCGIIARPIASKAINRFSISLAARVSPENSALRRPLGHQCALQANLVIHHDWLYGLKTKRHRQLVHIEAVVTIIYAAVGLVKKGVFDAPFFSEQELQTDFSGKQQGATEVVLAEFGLANHKTRANAGEDIEIFKRRDNDHRRS